MLPAKFRSFWAIVPLYVIVHVLVAAWCSQEQQKSGRRPRPANDKRNSLAAYAGPVGYPSGFA